MRVIKGAKIGNYEFVQLTEWNAYTYFFHPVVYVNFHRKRYEMKSDTILLLHAPHSVSAAADKIYHTIYKQQQHAKASNNIENSSCKCNTSHLQKRTKQKLKK